MYQAWQEIGKVCLDISFLISDVKDYWYLNHFCLFVNYMLSFVLWCARCDFTCWVNADVINNICCEGAHS